MNNITIELDQADKEITTATLDQADEKSFTDTVSDEELEVASGAGRMCNPTGQVYYSNC